MESKIPAVEVKLGFKWQGLLIAVIVGLGIWLIPTPEGLSAKAWGMLALFVATIVAIIAKAMPMGAATLVALVISGLTGVTQISRCLYISDVADKRTSVVLRGSRNN